MVGRRTTLKGLGQLLVALALMAAMVALGLWQYRVYDTHQRADAVARMKQPPASLDSVLGPDQAFESGSVGVPVSVAGRYDRPGQLYVRGLEGSDDTYAVTTPLVTDSGSAILVVRGSSPSPHAETPAGEIRLTGILEPSQTGGTPVEAGRITDAISIASLVGTVHNDLYAGYVVATASQPAGDLTPVRAPLPDPSRWAGIRNLVYALQWWVFAGFVGFMWWRIVTDMRDTDTDTDTDTPTPTPRPATSYVHPRRPCLARQCLARQCLARQCLARPCPARPCGDRSPTDRTTVPATTLRASTSRPTATPDGFANLPMQQVAVIERTGSSGTVAAWM